MTRKANIGKIRAEHPENLALLAITDDLENYAAIAAIASQEGGRLLTKGLVDDVVSGLERIVSSFKTAPHAELMGACAGVKSNWDLLRVLTRAEKNKNLANEALEEALKT